MKNLNQQLLNFGYTQNFKDEDYYVNSCNYYAFELINSWPKWEKNFLNIFGEKHSGKTHLASIFLKKSKSKYIDTHSELLYAKGDVVAAVKTIREAIRLDPENSYYKQQIWKFKNVVPESRQTFQN